MKYSHEPVTVVSGRNSHGSQQEWEYKGKHTKKRVIGDYRVRIHFEKGKKRKGFQIKKRVDRSVRQEER